MQLTNQDLAEFNSEAIELIDAAERQLLEIGSGGDFKIAFDLVFRCFHNMKGGAGLMELVALERHTHQLETTLLGFKESGAIPKESVTYFLQGLDQARALLIGEDGTAKPAAALAEPETVPGPVLPSNALPEEAMQEFYAECGEIIERVASHLKTIDSCADLSAPSDELKSSVDALYRDFHSLKGNAFLFSFQRLGDIAHRVESALEPARSGAQSLNRGLIDGVYRELKRIEEEVERIKEPARPVTVSAPAKEKERDRDVDAGSIRVSINLLDGLMTLMGEMVLVRNQLIQFSSRSDDQEFTHLSKRLSAVTAEIQDGMMKTRLQPVGNIIGKFSRIARDLSQELGKNIVVSMSGNETELDRSLLEAIKDPLTHIVRNSCDHGIEKPEARAKAGKPEAGTIEIRSFHEGGQVVISVSDDGRGLDRALLAKKGVEKGLISQAQAESMSEREIFGLIFAPGFSTASAVTNVSGRGVGMDVVRTNIEKTGGTVELQSILGKGTTIVIRIPLTLAIVPALLVGCREGLFAIPQVKLAELVRVDPVAGDKRIERLQGVQVYRLRGELLPLVRLGDLLHPTHPRQDDESAVVNIAVLNTEHGAFGLVVDEVHDTADIVVKPLNRMLKNLTVYSGATVLGDGTVGLILDVAGLSKFARLGISDSPGASEAGASREVAAERGQSQDYVLVQVNSPTRHAFVLGYVHRLEEFKVSDVESYGSRRVVRYRESLLYLMDVGRMLGYPVTPGAPQETLSVVVIEKAGTLYGFVVDRILDTIATDVDAETGIEKQHGIYGHLNTPQELLVLIDPFELVQAEFNTPAGAGAVAPGPAARRPLRILLVEDTVFFRKAMTLVLSKAGHEIVQAQDGQEALELFNAAKGAFDMIVSDIEMPRMNGFELAKAIRSGTSNTRIPMLAITSRAGVSQRALGKEVGFDSFLEKLKPEQLLNTVAELTPPKVEAA